MLLLFTTVDKDPGQNMMEIYKVSIIENLRMT